MKIVMPKSNDRFRTGLGTKCFADDGQEITGITALVIDFSIDDMVTAKVSVCVSAIEDIQAHPLLCIDSVREAAERHGYRLAPIEDDLSMSIKDMPLRV